MKIEFSKESKNDFDTSLNERIFILGIASHYQNPNTFKQRF
jgi:hypothetical protein